MKYIKLFTSIVLFTGFGMNISGQIKQDCSGNIGIGFEIPIGKVELQDQKYFIFNTHDNQSGILFHETQGKTATAVQYGSFIEYDENNDALGIGTFQNNSKLPGMYFWRNTGYVGIGVKNTSWTYELEVNDDAYIFNDLKIGGDAWVHGTEVITSDERVKKDITQINAAEAMEMLSQINGKNFYYKEETELEAVFETANSIDSIINDSTVSVTEKIEIPHFPKGLQYGLIAQEVGKVLPEIVLFDSVQKIYGINYNAIIPILIEAVKGQQDMIAELKAEIRTANNKSGEILGDKEIKVSDNTLISRLFQNIPNPFSENTTIEYYIAESVKTATIYIYNLNGQQLKSIPIYQKCSGSITIFSGELKAGMYMYTLITDGKVIDTKQMILTD